MKTIFLIDGASGTGKSDMIKYITTKKRNVATVVPKFTTRPQRREEQRVKLDLLFPPDSREKFISRTEDPDFYWYTYGNKDFGEEYYGFNKSDIEDALNHYDFVLIVVRDHETISAIKRDFRHIRVISIFIYSDRDLMVQRLESEGYSKNEINQRLNRQPLTWNDYMKFSTDYDEIIVNSSKHEDFELLLESLFKKFSVTHADNLEITPKHTYRLITPLIGYKTAMLKKLEKYPFHRNVFLMMKFRGEANKRVYQYIKKTLASYDLNCVRSDEAIWDITRNTYNPVAVLYCCKYGIALFDEPEPGNDYSPNVAYELGIMHNQGKECLVLKSSAIKKVPFDLVKELYVDYGDNLELEDILENWISKLKDQ
jgi:guanylate kinase